VLLRTLSTVFGQCALAAAAGLVLTTAGVGSWARAQDRVELSVQAKQIFGTLPVEAPSESNPVTEPKIELGRKLYYDARLSKNHDVSCNSCHGLSEFGVDGEPTSKGHRDQRGGRNSPTVYNAAFHIAQFWDGRAADVEAQAKGPPLNPIEMAMPSEQAVEAVLQSIPDYGPLFRAAFPDEDGPITYDQMARAIGAFERRLVTPSDFDRFQSGELDILSEAELRGLDLFVATGCITCHNGPALGGAMYQKIGLVHPYPTADLGRYEVTKSEADRYAFKVPSLRNVAKTRPYFHDGRIPTLEEVAVLMAHHQLGRELPDEDVKAIVAFLGSLTGAIDAEYIAMPELPESGPSTPAPDPN
jgi:cytochrome c peroxidase